MSKRTNLWLAAVAAITVLFFLCALILPRSFTLTVLSDLIQCLLLFSGAAAFFQLAWTAQRRMRLFWALITLGVSLWLLYQVLWTYYEVLLRKDVPDLCSWDIILFLHVVPPMAAIALRPHVPRDEYGARAGRLDFALLGVWWCYLYVLIVMPWQYVVPDVAAYNRNLNSVYNAEKLAFLAGLLACWFMSKGEWRKLYAALFGMSLAYSASSTIANWAIAHEKYYSGSFYDLPLVASMASLTWIALKTRAQRPASGVPQASTAYGVWVARCSMLALLSLPLFAAWAMSDEHVPQRIRIFRLTLSLVVAFFMGVMVFVRQHTLDRELFRLLNFSRDSFDNLKRLQSQILQSEKLASIGQLVGGAAHELNNPITAMLGYSDLLLATALNPEQQPLAAKISQHVRRTRSLVASLISFARQTPAPKTPLDLNTLARTALKLTQSQWEALEIDVRTRLDTQLPKIMGDSNQLLQVCLQLLANCFHFVEGHDGAVVTISTESRNGHCVLTVATEHKPAHPDIPMLPAEGGIDGNEDGLALSACQGIVQDHRGKIVREQSENGCFLQVELPAADLSRRGDSNPLLLQARPFA